MTKKVALVLSGCGFKDGAEIHESVCSLLAIEEAGAQPLCFAPDIDYQVVDHLSGEATGEKRNVLREAARIARGEIRNLAEAKADDFDALLLPGGYGAAKNLSNFATQGAECQLLPELEALIQAVHKENKPIAGICIAPVLIAKALSSLKPTLTIGNDPGTAKALESMGACHSDCPTTEFIQDQQHKIITTPAYMLGPSILDVYRGIQKTVQALLEMT